MRQQIFCCHGNLDYEFRTTVVRELHTQKDFKEIAGWLAGAKEYYLQAYKDSDGVLRPGYGSYTFEELQNFQKILQKDRFYLWESGASIKRYQ